MKIIATPIAYISVFGVGILLADVNHKFLGQISLRQVEGSRAEQEALRDRLVAAINAGQAESQVYHPGRGSTYDVLPEATFQVSKSRGIAGTKSRMIVDGDPVTVYRNEYGIFVRFPDEMVSPRFQEIKS